MKIKDIKTKNISKILNALRINGEISKKDLSGLIKLAPSTLTEICSELLKKGIIKELGEVDSDKRGRKKILLSINYDYKKIIGIDIKNNYCSFVLTNLSGEIIESKILNPETIDPNELVKFLIVEIKDIIKKNNLKKMDILGIGISLVGAVNSEKHSTVDFIGFWNESFPIGQEIEDKIEIPVFVNNNVKNLSIYQMFINEKLSDFFFLKYGSGIGGSLVVQKEIFKKEASVSGEIGHSIVIEDENICPICKRKGCFENNFSERAIIRKIKLMYSKEKTPILYSLTLGKIDEITFDTVLSAAEKGEILILELLQRAANYLAMILLNMFTLFYPEKIILCGKIFKSELFLNYFFSYIHNKQILDFKKIVEISSISTKEETIAPIFSVLRENFY